MNMNTDKTTSRILLAPVAIVVMLLLWLLVNWEVGLGAAWLVIYLAPDLMVIFSTKWRKQRAVQARLAEEEKRRHELMRVMDSLYGDNSDDDVDDDYDDVDDDSPSEMDLDITMDDDVDYDVTVNIPIRDLIEYEDEKDRYLSAATKDLYRLARLRDFIRETVENCDPFDTLPKLFDDPLLQNDIEQLV